MMIAHCAEVLESTLVQWQAAAVDIYHYPGFGSLLTSPSGEGQLYAIVTEVRIAAADVVHTPVPMGLSREELALLHPESYVHTRVTLVCNAVGYHDGTRLLYQLPAHPPALHALVYEATEQLYQDFFATEQYLPMIICAPANGISRDELLLALIAQRQRRNALSTVQLQQFIGAVSPFVMADYSRFRQFLQRVERSAHAPYA